MDCRPGIGRLEHGEALSEIPYRIPSGSGSRCLPSADEQLLPGGLPIAAAVFEGGHQSWLAPSGLEFPGYATADNCPVKCAESDHKKATWRTASMEMSRIGDTMISMVPPQPRPERHPQSAGRLRTNTGGRLPRLRLCPAMIPEAGSTVLA